MDKQDNESVATETAPAAETNGKGKKKSKVGKHVTPSALASAATKTVTGMDGVTREVTHSADSETPETPKKGKGKKPAKEKPQKVTAIAVVPAVPEKPITPPDKIDPKWAAEFMRWYKTTSQGVIEMAIIADQVRNEYGYKSFEGWVEKRLGLSRQTGDNFLRVNDNLIKSGYTKEELMNLDPTALYRLAANTVPDKLRKRLIGKAQKQDRPMNAGQVEDAVAAWKSAQEKLAATDDQTDDAIDRVASGEVGKENQEAIASGSAPSDLTAGQGGVSVSRPAAAPNAVAADKLSDEIGNPLPDDDEIQEAFARATEIDDDVDKIGEIVKKVTRRSGNADPLYTFFNLTQFKVDANNAISQLQHTRPYALCPQHPTDKISRDKCAWCKGQGWLSKAVYMMASESMKAGATGKESDNGKEPSGETEAAAAQSDAK